jgi:putative radical SAM enzyme (TIGR03279 family)
VITIAEIEAGSLAEELELRIGTRVVRINGEKVRDGIDLTFLLADGELELETVDPDGNRVIYEVDRDPGEPMGIIPAPDTVRECANACVFCFIDGNPKDVRPSLWIRDDDFRLSFSYGSFVTLTNLGPKGLGRLVEQRLSPLYVSVHTTDPDLRVRMLKNERAGLVMDQLRELLDGGLEVHTQIVLCPEWNDGAHLDRTMEDLWSLGDGIRTLSVVPVGLTRFNVNRPVRPLLPREAREAVAQVEAIRAHGLRERGYGWVYAADELFLLAGLPLPGPAYYDDASLLENGVGAVRHFLDHLDGELPHLPNLGPDRRVHILTGRSMAPLLAPRVGDLERALGGASVSVTGVTNEFYGPLVTVAGLLAGEDLLRAARALGPHREADILLLPGETLNQDNLFIDSLPLERFRAELGPLHVIPAFEIPEGLRSFS